MPALAEWDSFYLIVGSAAYYVWVNLAKSKTKRRP